MEQETRFLTRVRGVGIRGSALPAVQDKEHVERGEERMNERDGAQRHDACAKVDAEKTLWYLACLTRIVRR